MIHGDGVFGSRVKGSRRVWGIFCKVPTILPIWLRGGVFVCLFFCVVV